MKKISRRSFLAVCGTLAAATALTACGGSSSSTASSAAAGSSEAASVEVQDVARKVWGPQEDQVDSSSWLPTIVMMVLPAPISTKNNRLLSQKKANNFFTFTPRPLRFP